MGEAAGAENLPTCRIAPGPDTPAAARPTARDTFPPPGDTRIRTGFRPAKTDPPLRSWVNSAISLKKSGGGIFFAANRYLRKRIGTTHTGPTKKIQTT